jgi:hypothetical protein
MSGEQNDCARMRAMAAEVALGIADGADRAWALDHLAGCTGCRGRVEELSALADELVMLAPSVEPPPDFEGRVAGAIEPPRKRLRQRFAIPAVAAVAAACAAAAMWFALADDRDLADDYRATLAVANGEHFDAKPVLLADGTKVGYVYGYQGRTSWVLAVMYDCPYDGTYELEGVTTDGSRIAISPIEIQDGRGSVGRATSVDYDSLAEIHVVDEAGHEVAASDLAS